LLAGICLSRSHSLTHSLSHAHAHTRTVPVLTHFLDNIEPVS
jgi:hypothetical protein